MTKRRLIKVAFEQATKDKQGIEQLNTHLKGMPALLFTKENPFTLYKTLKKNKSPAPAKPGQEAPRDITVPAGPTPFAPGPIIGELGKFGLKTGVENGKVAVKEGKVVCKEGAVINKELAGLLTRLQIYPMEVGLDLVAVYEEGEILTKNILDIDEEQFMKELTRAAAEAFNLGVNASIHNNTTTPAMITKAAAEAINVSVETGYLTTETTEIILGRAEATAKALASSLPEDARPQGLVITTPSTAPAKQEPSKKPDKEKEPEEDVATGLGALFG